MLALVSLGAVCPLLGFSCALAESATAWQSTALQLLTPFLRASSCNTHTVQICQAVLILISTCWLPVQLEGAASLINEIWLLFTPQAAREGAVRGEPASTLALAIAPLKSATSKLPAQLRKNAAERVSAEFFDAFEEDNQARFATVSPLLLFCNTFVACKKLSARIWAPALEGCQLKKCKRWRRRMSKSE